MKLGTYVVKDSDPRACVLVGDRVLDLERLGLWAKVTQLPDSTLALLRLGPDAMAAARTASEQAAKAHLDDLMAQPGLVHMASEVSLRTPLPDPPSVRDFYAFEQHVKAARARRGAEMIPEWYQFPVFYFTNSAALFGDGEDVPYPRASKEVDFELEMACVIGREGSDISADDAPGYIAGYMVMNDWSARDLQREEMKMNLGPAKGKDFATSFGPWLVTPDELEDKRVGSGKDERFDLRMTGRINGIQLTDDNAKTIHFTFPQMIERAAQHVKLRPGDILGSGTCGTGCILELGTERHRWLQPGDVVEMEIERLGVIRNQLVEKTK